MILPQTGTYDLGQKPFGMGLWYRLRDGVVRCSDGGPWIKSQYHLEKSDGRRSDTQDWMDKRLAIVLNINPPDYPTEIATMRKAMLSVSEATTVAEVHQALELNK